MNNNNNNTNDTDVDWVNVMLLKKLKCFLYKSDIIEISLASKTLREKFAPYLFNHILVDDILFAKDIEYFGLTHEYREKTFSKELVQQFRASDNFQNYLVKRDYKNLVIDPYLKSVKEKFEPCSKYVKSFIFNQVFQPLYYIIELAKLTTNLNTLRINTGFLLLKDFQTILDGLWNLTDVALVNVTFVKFESDKPLINALSFPTYLSQLTVLNTKLIKRRYKKGAYQLLFGGFSITPEPLPIALDYLPYLRTLEYDNEFQSTSFIGDFLRINPYIFILGISFITLMQDNIEPDMLSTVTRVALPSLSSITEDLSDSQYLKLKDIYIFEFNTTINANQELFTSVISSLENLKMLYINLDNCIHFNGIENIIFQLKSLGFINVNPSKVIKTLNSQYSYSNQRWFELNKLLGFAKRLLYNAPNSLTEINFNFADLTHTQSAGIKKLDTLHRGWQYKYSNGKGIWHRKKYEWRKYA